MITNMLYVISWLFLYCLLPCSQVGVNPEAHILQSPVRYRSELKDSLNRPESVKPERDGTIRLQAQVGWAIGKEIKYMPEWKAFGWFKACNRVEWDVKVKKKGKYDVHLEWSVSDEVAGKPFIFQAGDQQLHGKVGRTGAWEIFCTKKIGQIELLSGHQKMVFKPDPRFEKDFGGSSLMDLRELRLIPIK